MVWPESTQEVELEKDHEAMVRPGYRRTL